MITSRIHTSKSVIINLFLLSASSLLFSSTPQNHDSSMLDIMIYKGCETAGSVIAKLVLEGLVKGAASAAWPNLLKDKQTIEFENLKLEEVKWQLRLHKAQALTQESAVKMRAYDEFDRNLTSRKNMFDLQGTFLNNLLLADKIKHEQIKTRLDTMQMYHNRVANITQQQSLLRDKADKKLSNASKTKTQEERDVIEKQCTGKLTKLEVSLDAAMNEYTELNANFSNDAISFQTLDLDAIRSSFDLKALTQELYRIKAEVEGAQEEEKPAHVKHINQDNSESNNALSTLSDDDVPQEAPTEDQSE